MARRPALSANAKNLLTIVIFAAAVMAAVVFWRGRTLDADMGNWCTSRLAGCIVLYCREQGSWPADGLSDLESAGLVVFDGTRRTFRVLRASECIRGGVWDDQLRIDASLIEIADSPDAEVLIDWKGWGRGYLDLAGLSWSLRACIAAPVHHEE